ncbi:MAG: hypothetical protein HZC55_18275 [Verrucomicrobia bacterium]|nr:hypothetical protein [Verrucomicrobiota bacterium]
MNRTHVLTASVAFVTGVFVGAQLWLALVIFAVAVAAWHLLGPPPPRRYLKP